MEKQQADQVALTPGEEMFFRRVGLTMAREGLSVQEAMYAVQRRDEELFLLKTTHPEQWKELVSEMAAELYREIRGKG